MGEVKFTPGPVKADRAKHPDNTGGYDYAISDQDNCIIAECFEHVGYAGGTEKQYIAFPAAENALLVAEAFNIATETRLTPRQLLDLANQHRAQAQIYLEQREELRAALIFARKRIADDIDVMNTISDTFTVHGKGDTSKIRAAYEQQELIDTETMKIIDAAIAKATTP